MIIHNLLLCVEKLITTDILQRNRDSVIGGGVVSKDLWKKRCTDRESNPGLPRGRREFYH